MKKLFKGVLVCGTVLSFATAGLSSWWLFQNNNYQLARVAQPAKNIKVTKQDQPVKDVVYTPSVEVRTPEQIEKARADTSQPLYLRNLLSIPNLGINLQVFEGTSDRVLTYGAGTIKPGQNPDQIGNYALAAHNFSDASYGMGFSILQHTSPEVIKNSYAYLSDGDKVYTYKLQAYTDIVKEDSMFYTEDDFAEQVFPELMAQAPAELKETVVKNQIWNKNGTYTESAEGQTFDYGRLLTLYTCKIEPGGGLVTVDRIIVTGVQVKNERLEDAPEDVKKLFLDKSQNLDLTGETAVPETETKEVTQTQEDKNTETVKPLSVKELPEESKNPLEAFANRELKKDPDWMFKVFWSSFVMAAIFGFALVLIPWKNKKGGRDRREKNS